MKFTIRMKGGEGSGNFGHAGREGEVGGSAPEGGGGGENEWETLGYHGTDSANKILNGGFNLSAVGKGSDYPGILGVGVYVDTSLDRGTAKLYGKDIIGVKIKHSLKLFDATKDTMVLYTSKTDYGDPAKITEYYKKLGYDGIKATGQTVIFDPTNVKAYKVEKE